MDDYFFYCQQIMASKIAYWAINYMNYFELTIKPIQQTDNYLNVENSSVSLPQ